MDSSSGGRPPDNNNGSDKNNNVKMSYASALAKRQNNIREATKKINLNSTFKWETFIIVLTENDTERAFNNRRLKHINIYNAAMHFGFSEEEIAGAQPQYGFGYASFYTNEPINIRDRIDSLKKEYSTEVEGPNGELRSIKMKIKGIQNVDFDRKKNIKIKAINTLKRVDEEGVVEWIKNFAEVLNAYPEPNPEDEEAERKYKKYKSVWRTSNFIVEANADSNTIPQILPVKGHLVNLRFPGVRLQCQNCFQFGHARTNCNGKRLQIIEYETVLKQKIKEIKKRTTDEDPNNCALETRESSEKISSLKVIRPEQEKEDSSLIITKEIRESRKNSSLSTEKSKTLQSDPKSNLNPEPRTDDLLLRPHANVQGEETDGSSKKSPGIEILDQEMGNKEIIKFKEIHSDTPVTDKIEVQRENRSRTSSETSLADQTISVLSKKNILPFRSRSGSVTKRTLSQS
ncbi:Uncharacterized protein FKW44_014277, partial [Caligus rogercresseyi]